MSKNEQNFIQTSSGERVALCNYDFSASGAVFNREEALRNLSTTKKILDLAGVRWGLTFGTLLGAVRESDFIEHDTDVDLAIYPRHDKKFIDSLPRFIEVGFELIRFEKSVVSLIRKGVYLDFYFCRKSLVGFRIADNQLQSQCMRFDESTKIRGKDFPCHNNKLHVLQKFYGPNWRVPIKNSPATPNPILWKRIVAFLLPNLAGKLGAIRKRIFIQKFQK